MHRVPLREYVAQVDTSHDQGINGAVAALLREERLAQVLTLEELAARSGIPAVSVQRFLAARRAINLEVLLALSHGLGISPVDVMAQAMDQVKRGDPDLVARVRRGMGRPTSPVTDNSWSKVGTSVTQSI